MLENKTGNTMILKIHVKNPSRIIQNLILRIQHKQTEMSSTKKSG